MSEPERYPVPAARHRVEQTIDRSRFLCTLERVATPEAAQAFLKEMNAEFPDATHNCGPSWRGRRAAPGASA